MTAPPVVTLTEFLLARIAEDEAAAREPQGYEYAGSLSRVFDPARVLAECEAKRQIITLADWEGVKDSLRDRLFGPSADVAFQAGIERAMRALARPYADHPDYRDEWRP